MFRTCFAATIAEVKGARQAFITSRFEIDSKGLPTDANILEFCFPLGAAAVVPKEYQAVEEFLFALTGGGGDRLYGFCRHSLPPNRPGEGNGRGIAKLQRYPQALCIVSPHPWAQFFFRVLEVLDRTLRALPSPTLNGHAFLRDLDAAAPAALGSVLRLPWPACLHVGSLPRQHRAFASPADPGAWLAAGEGGVLELEVPPDVGGGASTAGIPLAPLLWHLTPRLAVSLLAALLMERRVVVVSADLGRLTAAVAAAAALLHPFHWQHIFLPLVPASLLDYLAAPMPFLAGVPAACLPTLRTLAMEEAAFDDLRDLQRSPAEAASTPKAAEIVRAWAGLVHVARSTGSVQRARSDTSIRAHGFVFDLEGFVNGPRRASRLAAFFAAFRHSQMFEVFVVERCAAAAQGYPLTDAFEAEVSDRVGQGASPLAAAAAAAAARGAGSRIGSLWRKTSDVVRQSSDTLVTAVRTLGTLQDDYPLPG
ncbi:DENN domain-containing protein 1B [Auxenochlorella protothecoides]|uniref:DENN domain-containing protein 1B n=1 Tax=Auxenochlorella protothecoides TaxID=3075 RepID=A0A087SKW1_AUXPR|nr:DENN domain-containing protein 1B [Auxenochlorella protothecoides]KFM26365.1 DENN domain-containing protein 1B [Auxenochlorella protothecoides]